MREWTERHLVLHPEWTPERTVDALEAEVRSMTARGWTYLGIEVDAIIAHATLTFERLVDS